ncbi:hypothetical protein BJ170DRAFT_603623 [Xylariales sp. AK1849]|nr:hypothetical protein BJ170DRAFT_603623 [Xylariales sp. AK1849]
MQLLAILTEFGMWSCTGMGADRRPIHDKTQQTRNDDEMVLDPTVPLLSPSMAASDSLARPLLVPPPSRRTRCSWPWFYTVAGCIMLTVVVDLGEHLRAAPRIRLFKSIVCMRYYVQDGPFTNE